MWGKCIIAGVQEIKRGREDVAVLLHDVWHSAAIYFGCVRFRILWTKFTFLKVKVCVVVEHSGNEEKMFWNDLDMVVERVGNG